MSRGKAVPGLPSTHGSNFPFRILYTKIPELDHCSLCPRLVYELQQTPQHLEASFTWGTHEYGLAHWQLQPAFRPSFSSDLLHAAGSA